MDVVVEGLLDESVVRRIFADQDQRIGNVYVKHGKGNILAKLDGYNAAARYRPFFVLVDLDRDHDCAPEFLADRLGEPAPRMTCRVAVPSVEAWLLADRHRIASFLGVAPTRIANDPDNLPNAKQHLAQVALRSRKRLIRDGIPPRSGSGRTEGPIYAGLLSEFVSNESNGWRPDVAAMHSRSLRKAMSAVAGSLST